MVVGLLRKTGMSEDTTLDLGKEVCVGLPGRDEKSRSGSGSKHAKPTLVLTFLHFSCTVHVRTFLACNQLHARVCKSAWLEFN